MAKLTDLPNELIDEIVALVFAANPKQYLGAVHRLFLPFSRRLVFREVDIGTYRRLALLCEIGRENPQAVAQVRKFRLRFAGQMDLKQPTTGAVLSLFRAMPNLEELSIGFSARLVKAVLSINREPTPFPSLQILELEDPFADWSNPFDPVHFLNLHYLPNLGSLAYSVVQRTARSISPCIPSNRTLDSPFSWFLDLRGPFMATSAVHDLVRFFPEVDGLILRMGADVKSPLPLLRQLLHPEYLTVLSFGGTAHTLEDFLAILELCPHLCLLEASPPPSFETFVSSLLRLSNLEELDLLSGSNATTAGLKRLVDPKTKPAEFETLSDNTVQTCPCGYCYVDGWHSTFTLDGMVEVIELAEDSGVKVEGLAAVLARMELEYRRSGQEE